QCPFSRAERGAMKRETAAMTAIETVTPTEKLEARLLHDDELDLVSGGDGPRVSEFHISKLGDVASPKEVWQGAGSAPVCRFSLVRLAPPGGAPPHPGARPAPPNPEGPGRAPPPPRA